MSQNSQGSGGTPALAKALTLPHAPRAPPHPGEDNASGRLLRAIYREPGKVWARVFREARLRAGAARGTAGRGHRCRGNTAHGESGPAGGGGGGGGSGRAPAGAAAPADGPEFVPARIRRVAQRPSGGARSKADAYVTQS